MKYPNESQKIISSNSIKSKNKKIIETKKLNYTKKKKMTIKEVIKYLEDVNKTQTNSKNIVSYECVQEQTWHNTNRLLKSKDSYIGIKTGNTPNAKFCLASKKEINNSSLTTSKL